MPGRPARCVSALRVRDGQVLPAAAGAERCDACAVAVIAACWTRLWRTSGDLKNLDKLGIDLETSLAAIALAPVDSVVTVIRAPMEALNQLDAAVHFILPLFPTSPSKAGSRNPPPPLSPF